MHNPKPLLRTLACVALSGALAWAGQSVVLTTTGGTSVDPNIFGQSFRVEFQIHGWTGSTNGNGFALNGTGMSMGINATGSPPILGVGVAGYYYPGNCNVNLTGITNGLVRVQMNASGSTVDGIPPVTFVTEIWNYNAQSYNSCSQTTTGTYGNSATGGTFGGMAADLAFLNVFTTLVPLGSQPPVTASRGNRTAITFDCTSSPSNCLTDLSGNGHNVTYAGASYVTTPNQVAVALPKTFGAPAWSNWISLRAGYPSQLDGTASYSLADASSAVNYSWQEVIGPSTVVWANQTSGTPTVTGLVFGTYNFSLQVTDVAGTESLATLQTGAVAYDDNGVVIPPDPRVTQIFGPQIAFGQNPWSYQDQQNLYAVNAQIPYQAARNDFSWANPRTGTVSYPFAGKGFNPGPSCTTLSAQMLVTDTTISITNGACLSLSSLPTWILVGNLAYGSGAYEMVRVCSVASGSITGAVVMNVCYDGRGVSGANPYTGGMTQPTFPSATWPSGTNVGEFRIQGTSTSFLTDPNGAACPAGAPGPMGIAIPGPGTVTLTSGSTTVTGSGSGWTGAITGQQILISGTHSGIAFNFWAQLTYVSATSATMNRPAPAGMDSYSGLSYQIINQTYLSLEVASAADGHIFRLLNAGQGCESETAMFAVPFRDIPTFDSTTQSGVGWSYKGFLSEYTQAGTTEPNFYGSGGLMPRSFYYRSGYAAALTLANSVDEYYIRDPEISEGIGCFEPFPCGGGIIGAAADLVLNPNTVLIWPNLETSASGGETGGSACNYTDTRDYGYQTTPLVFAANYDTNPTNQAAFTTALASVLTTDLGCQRTAADGYSAAEQGSFANSGYTTNFRSSVLVLTNGSTAVTAGAGASFVAGNSSTAGDCYGVDQVTLKVANGSSLATVMSGTLSQQNLLWFYDGVNTGVYAYSVSGASVQLAGVWTGASGTYNAMSTGGGEIVNSGVANGGYGAIWTGADESFTSNEALRKAWACVWNSPTSLTLFRPWDGPSSSSLTGGASYKISYYNTGAFHQQPFFTGILAYRLRQSLNSFNSTIVNNAQSILTNLGNWFATVGYDATNHHGSFYDTIQTACGSQADMVAGSFSSIHGQQGCGQVGSGLQYAGGPPEYLVSRVNNVEGGNAMMQYYLANPSPTTRALVDQFYGAVFGQAGTCSASVASTCDGYTATNYDNGSLSGYKWPGFFFGMGGFFTSSWPAVRNGGRAAHPRTVSVGFDMGSAVSAKITVIAPSGAVTTVACLSSPCAITVDDRQGSHWYVVQRLSSGGQILSTADAVLLPLAPQP
jgi:hypothetical protein